MKLVNRLTEKALKAAAPKATAKAVTTKAGCVGTYCGGWGVWTGATDGADSAAMRPCC